MTPFCLQWLAYYARHRLGEVFLGVHHDLVRPEAPDEVGLLLRPAGSR